MEPDRALIGNFNAKCFKLQVEAIIKMVNVMKGVLIEWWEFLSVLKYFR